MRSIGSISLLPALCALGCSRAPQTPMMAQWDDTSAKEVQTQVEETMNAFVAMDVSGFESSLTQDVVAFEMDLENNPLRLRSRNEVISWAEDTFAAIKNMGASLQLDIHSNACRATTVLAYCLVEFDFTAAMADGTTMTQPSRNTVVLRKDTDGWKWTHWHSSVAPFHSGPASESLD